VSIAVLDKAFSMLEVLARTGRELTLAELAEEGRLPKPTVHRILRSLRDLGYVEQADRRGTYRLSGRLSSLREYGRDETLRAKALPVMTRLREDFDETVNLGLLEGIFIRYVHVIETSQALRWIVKPGARDHFNTTALGRAIVANLPDEQQQRLLAKAVVRKNQRTKLQQELSVTRVRGCAIEEEETVPGVACVAVSLAWLGEPLAAISVSVPVHRFPVARRTALIDAMVRLRERAVAV
jgi:DNA-binding IclR family transcriptional regulator